MYLVELNMQEIASVGGGAVIISVNESTDGCVCTCDFSKAWIFGVNEVEGVSIGNQCIVEHRIVLRSRSIKSGMIKNISECEVECITHLGINERLKTVTCV